MPGIDLPNARLTLRRNQQEAGGMANAGTNSRSTLRSLAGLMALLLGMGTATAFAVTPCTDKAADLIAGKSNAPLVS